MGKAVRRAKRTKTGKKRANKSKETVSGLYSLVKDKFWKHFIYAYLLLPIFIFVLGWLRWYLAIPLAAGIVYAFIRCVREDHTIYEDVITKENWLRLTVALAIIAAWVLLSGIGGICYQNYDHFARSTIYRALVEYEWPVISEDGTRTLIYYIGFWLPASIVGKMFGFEAGYFFQILWTILGVWLVYIMLCVWRRKVSLWPLGVMIFFSGLDIIGWWIMNPDSGGFPKMELLEFWATDLQFSSMTTQLFWVFNQSVPAWVGIMLIMLLAEQNSRRNMLLVSGTLMLTSTFPFIGVLPFVVYFLIRGFRFEKENRKERFREILSVQNVIGVFGIGIVSLLYLTGNVSAGNISRDTIALSGTDANLLGAAVRTLGGFSVAFITIPFTDGQGRYFWFYLLEFGLYSIMIHKYEYKNPVHYIIIGTLLVCPLIKVGGQHDFGMRASIPALFILMLLVIRSLERIAKKKSFWLYPALLVLALGAVTPFNEIHRSIDETITRRSFNQSVRQPEVAISKLLTYSNFSGEADNFFMKYLGK